MEVSEQDPPFLAASLASLQTPVVRGDLGIGEVVGMRGVSNSPPPNSQLLESNKVNIEVGPSGRHKQL